MEFCQLKPGDYVHDGNPDDLWTVVCPFPRHNTLFLMKGAFQLSRQERWFWSLVVRLSDTACLYVADMLEVRVARVFDPKKWTKHQIAA